MIEHREKRSSEQIVDEFLLLPKGGTKFLLIELGKMIATAVAATAIPAGGSSLSFIMGIGAAYNKAREDAQTELDRLRLEEAQGLLQQVEAGNGQISVDLQDRIRTFNDCLRELEEVIEFTASMETELDDYAKRAAKHPADEASIWLDVQAQQGKIADKFHDLKATEFTDSDSIDQIAHTTSAAITDATIDPGKDARKLSEQSNSDLESMIANAEQLVMEAEQGVWIDLAEDEIPVLERHPKEKEALAAITLASEMNIAHSSLMRVVRLWIGRPLSVKSEKAQQRLRRLRQRLNALLAKRLSASIAISGVLQKASRFLQTEDLDDDTRADLQERLDQQRSHEAITSDDE